MSYEGEITLLQRRAVAALIELGLEFGWHSRPREDFPREQFPEHGYAIQQWEGNPTDAVLLMYFGDVETRGEVLSGERIAEKLRYAVKKMHAAVDNESLSTSWVSTAKGEYAAVCIWSSAIDLLETAAQKAMTVTLRRREPSEYILPSDIQRIERDVIARIAKKFRADVFEPAWRESNVTPQAMTMIAQRNRMLNICRQFLFELEEGTI